tara:strand:+ start:51 stop:863 length:813 start_codon:yes stop_codon:yes gene_type:complete
MMECKPVGETKQCKMCGKVLPIDNFKLVYKKSINSSYRRGRCNPCEIEYNHKRRGTWEKYLKEKSYVEELHLLQKEGKRRCRKCNVIKILDEFANDSSGKVYYKKKSCCKSCAYETWRVPKSKTKEYKEQKSRWDKKYRSKPEVKRRLNKQLNEKYHNNPAFKIKHLMRGRINKVLDRKKQSKRFTQELGCTFDELIVYLELKFYPDPKTGELMSWDNHGVHGWHVDHIKALHEFDLYDEEEFKKASHYTNLQPLWWWQNLEKNRGAKYK